MDKHLELDQFLNTPGPIFDVRSPSEFNQGRLPGAHNLPLFSNEERAAIGTAYKQIGRKEAVIKGMQYAAPKFASLLGHVEEILASSAPGSMAKIHCWRGGMRSGSFRMFLEMAGLPAVSLKGGYKSFRRWALDFLERPFKFHVLGGMTGSGKTSILKYLQQKGAQVIDLEELACHRGSSFGMLGLGTQPSNEQFENELANRLSTFDLSKPIWLENESRCIGCCKIPDAIFKSMCSSPLYLVERPLDERLAILSQTYWGLDSQELIQASLRLAKKLGMVKTYALISAIEHQDFQAATLLLLEYYDRSYQYEMQRHRRSYVKISKSGHSDEQWANELLMQTEPVRSLAQW